MSVFNDCKVLSYIPTDQVRLNWKVHDNTNCKVPITGLYSLAITYLNFYEFVRLRKERLILWFIFNLCWSSPHLCWLMIKPPQSTDLHRFCPFQCCWSSVGRIFRTKSAHQNVSLFKFLLWDPEYFGSWDVFLPWDLEDCGPWTMKCVLVMGPWGLWILKFTLVVGP